MNAQVTYEEYAECHLPVDLGNVQVALGKMRDYCRARGLRPNLWNEIELAVAEGLNNAIEHGCAGQIDAQAVIRWRWSGDKLIVEITDPGDYLPPPLQATLPEDVLAEGGRGAYLMVQLMDRVQHSRTKRGHTLTLEKTVGEATWSAADGAEMEATLESMAEDLSRSYEDLSALFRFAEELATSTTLAEFLDRSLARLLALVKGQTAFVYSVAGGGSVLELKGAPPTQLPWLPAKLPLDADTGSVIAAAFTGRKSTTIEDCSTLPEGPALRNHKGSAYVCPIFFRSTPLGCLIVTRSAYTPYFSAGELGLIRVVADFLGIVQTTNTLQEQRQAQQRALRELEIAASIQQSLLPQIFPDSPSYRVFGVCQSALEVGGDYFDALNIGNEGLLLVIADVMGKGVPAALLATIFRTAVHARLDLAKEPGRLLTEVNAQIAGDLAHLDMFITAQVAYLSHKENTLMVANAGHCPVLRCIRKESRVEQLNSGGIPLGIIDVFTYETQSYPVANGDRFVFLTDGLYEVENSGGVMLNLDCLEKEIARLSPLPSMEFCAMTLKYVRNYTGDTPPSDDRTLLTVERITS